MCQMAESRFVWMKGRQSRLISSVFGAFGYTRPIHYRYGGCGEPWLRLGDRRGTKQVG